MREWTKRALENIENVQWSKLTMTDGKIITEAAKSKNTHLSNQHFENKHTESPPVHCSRIRCFC